MPTRRTLAALVLLIALAPLAACKSETGPRVQTIETTTFAPALNVDLSQMQRTTNGVYYRDLVVGQGARLDAGTPMAAYYTGWLANGTQFDSNVGASSPLPFTLGAGRVIPGWDEGLLGMHVGGRRQLVIPPALAYGSHQYGPIPANSILVFVVDAVAAN